MPNHFDDESEKRRPGGRLFGTALGLDLGDDEDDTSFFGRHRPDSFFSLSDGVGEGQANKPRDVAKVQSLLGNWNEKVLGRTQGPTGYWGAADGDAVWDYQQRHGLKVDGYLRPGGQTIRSLRRGMRGLMQGHRAPTEQEVEDHHGDLRAGGPGKIAWRQPLPKIGGDGAGLPAVADEDRFSLDRSIEHLAGYSDPGGYPSFQAGEITREGAPALARTRYLLSGLEKRSPETAGRFLARLLRTAPESWRPALLGGPLPEPQPVGVLREKAPDIKIGLDEAQNTNLSAGTDDANAAPITEPPTNDESEREAAPKTAPKPDAATDREPSLPDPDRSARIFDGIADTGEKLGFRRSVEMLRHFREGSGKDVEVPSRQLRREYAIQEAEKVNRSRFEQSLEGKRIENRKTDSEPLGTQLLRLKEGDPPVTLKDNWTRSSTPWPGKDEFFASGTSKIESGGEFEAVRRGDAIHIKGTVKHHWSDLYDWDAKASYGGYGVSLEKAGKGKHFTANGYWRQPFEATMPIVDGRLGKGTYSWGTIDHDRK